MKPVYILGISAFYHDSAACLLKNGEIVAAAQEERFSRKKNDDRFPGAAIAYCLNEAGIDASELSWVAYYEKPLLKFERLLETYLAHAPKGFASFRRAMPLWTSKKLWIKELIKKELGYSGQVLFTEHHESHAASAFYPSPFTDAAFLTLDGVGEWATASYGTGSGNNLQPMAEMHFPDSLGLLYSAFTQYLGFEVNSGEYKVMGLAPYGTPRYKSLIEDKLLQTHYPDGSFMLNLEYFNYPAGLSMINKKFERLFGAPARKPGEHITQHHKDIASSIQQVTESLVRKMAAHVRQETGKRRLCVAGGVALNCVANACIRDSGIFDDLWVQPAAGDAGGALGAAFAVWYGHLNNRRDVIQKDAMQSALLGPAYTDHDIERTLRAQGAHYQKLTEQALVEEVAAQLHKGAVVGWFQGRMEFGPRALGGRSILADARNPQAKEHINARIKERELFRPFAPSILMEQAPAHFSPGIKSPYMLFTARVLPEKRAVYPSVVHVDGTARIQTVTREHGRYYALLKTFNERYECPVLLNTSFNGNDEPIVCTPEDAYASFKRIGLDCLAIGSYLVSQTPQDSHPKNSPQASQDALAYSLLVAALRAWGFFIDAVTVLLLLPIFSLLSGIAICKKVIGLVIKKPISDTSAWRPREQYAPLERQY